MTYDIVTIDWNPVQTVTWLNRAQPLCKDGLFRLLGDPKHVNLRCGGQSEFLNRPELYETDNVLYMDTDIVLLKDPEHIFDDMGDAVFAAPTALSDHPFFKQKSSHYKTLQKRWGEGYTPPTHIYTCMMAFKGIKHIFKEMYTEWIKKLRYLEKTGMYNGYISLEVGMSFMAPMFFGYDQIYHIPASTLNNLAQCRRGSPRYKKTATHQGKVYGSMVKDPIDCTALHYHSRKFLEPFDLGYLLDV